MQFGVYCCKITAPRARDQLETFPGDLQGERCSSIVPFVECIFPSFASSSGLEMTIAKVCVTANEESDVTLSPGGKEKPKHGKSTCHSIVLGLGNGRERMHREP